MRLVGSLRFSLKMYTKKFEQQTLIDADTVLLSRFCLSTQGPDSTLFTSDVKKGKGKKVSQRLNYINSFVKQSAASILPLHPISHHAGS